MFESSRKDFGMRGRLLYCLLLLPKKLLGKPANTGLFLLFYCALNFFIWGISNNTALSQGTNDFKIAIIGDSLTQGYGLLPVDNFVSQLQARISEDNYSVELLNLGVSGDTTAGGLSRFEWSISSGVSGVVIILGGNDLLRGIPPRHSYENLKTMIIKAKQIGLPVLLVGMTASSNFGSTFKKEFDQIYSRLEIEFDLFYYANFFNALNQEDIPFFLSFMQTDGIHPNRQGIQRIVDDFYPTFQKFLDNILLSS